MGSHEKHGTTFFGKLVCVCTTRGMPQRSQDRSPKGAAGEEYVFILYSVRNYLLGFRQISEVDILVQKTRISVVLRKIGIPVDMRLET